MHTLNDMSHEDMVLSVGGGGAGSGSLLSHHSNNSSGAYEDNHEYGLEPAHSGLHAAYLGLDGSEFYPSHHGGHHHSHNSLLHGSLHGLSSSGGALLPETKYQPPQYVGGKGSASSVGYLSSSRGKKKKGSIPGCKQES